MVQPGRPGSPASLTPSPSRSWNFVPLFVGHVRNVAAEKSMSVDENEGELRVFTSAVEEHGTAAAPRIAVRFTPNSVNWFGMSVVIGAAWSS